MNFIKIVFQKIWAVVMVLIKFCLFMAVMFGGAWALAPLGTIHSKDIDMSQFNNHPNEMMMNFFQTEYFSGYLFSVTIAVVLAGVYGMWQLHELGVHKAKEHKSAHVQIVFALSLCGLFISKTFWVIALVIALANWKHIGQSLSDVIRRGVQPKQDAANAETAAVQTSPETPAAEPSHTKQAPVEQSLEALSSKEKTPTDKEVA
ncbi:magnesium transporter [Vibrio sp. 10N.261.46.E12]|uniref:magnesium transporter n=1 Tax=unclassified Vibrio TaxID=2614977 RepID=UPI00097585D3|nr:MULTISPECIES: magnesium transporter [unclassified Vibrio]OMO36666.1 magnesium transporter [Vibrio sp. 10N.261.45.E1]PMJ27511.1 magnesium transporter [Vibrio sp. 10N.286.45.B6]PML87946.1 magnesium transporter [Vibrio sp. 10N.261.49.E11]PMM64775.1 magnesium transporter [Vibrio sp. 10N.261.46.F12]PMM84412.1 magnesium transporter [Vibrio sp. 10N.261.46.E8]